MTLIRWSKQGGSSPFRWDTLAERFLHGGLPVGRVTPMDPGLLHRGFYPGSARRIPKYKKGPREWNLKYGYNLSHPVRNLVQLTASPLVEKPPLLDQVQAKELTHQEVQQRRRRSRILRLLRLVGVGPGGEAQHRWTQFLRQPFFAWLVPPPPVDTPEGTDWGVSVVQHFVRKPVVTSRVIGYRPRWYPSYQGGRTLQKDLFRVLLLWRTHSVGPGILSRSRGWLTRERSGLPGRLRRAYCYERQVRRRARLADRSARYEKYVFVKTPKNQSVVTRRANRHKRRRLRGYLGHRIQANWFDLLGRTFFRRWAPNRGVWLEQLGLTQPAGNFTVELYTRVVNLLNRRVGSGLEYTYYKKFTRFSLFTNRKKPHSRRTKLGDHPVHREPFLESRALRWGWFHRGGWLSKLAEIQAHNKETPQPESDFFDTSRPPLEPGWWSLTYWNLHRWGRGSRWRTKPVGRARWAWTRAVKSGHAWEHDVVQWGHAATGPTGTKLTLLTEVEIPRPTAAVPRLEQLEVNPVVELPMAVDPGPPPQRSPWRILRRWLWWVCCPLWWVYAGVAKLWLSFWWLLCCVGWWAWTLAMSPLLLVWFFTAEVSRLVWAWVVTLPGESRFFQATRWVYTVWLMTYSSDDEGDDLEVYNYEEEDRDAYFTDDDDPTGMAGEDAGDLGGGPLQDPPRYPWEVWWNKEVDSFYDEGLEIAQDILLEELPYYLRLGFRPLVDFFVRLPLWGVLDGITALVAALKLDYQSFWFKVLSYGNKSNGVVKGRWWKWPLVFTRWVIHFSSTTITSFVLASSLDASTLKVWIVYTCGLPYQQEYYFLWWGVCFFGVFGLVGPNYLRSYFFDEIGLSNLVFLFVGVTNLGFPEHYYPHRARGFFRTEMLSRTSGFIFKDLYVNDASDRVRSSPLGFTTNEEFRVTMANLRGYNEFPWEFEIDDGPSAQAFAIPHLEELSLSRVYEANQVRWGHSMERRHPTLRRNNFYEIDFDTDQDLYPYTDPSYHANHPRNLRVLYSRSQSEVASTNYGGDY